MGKNLEKGGQKKIAGKKIGWVKNDRKKVKNVQNSQIGLPLHKMKKSFYRFFFFLHSKLNNSL